MTLQGDNEALIQALNSITSELKRINQTLSGLQLQSAPSAGRGPAPSRGPGPSRGPSYSRGPAPSRGAAGKSFKPRKEGYGASEVEGGGDRDAAPRFSPKRAPSAKGPGKPKTPKSPLSFKKKEGYPKRPKP